MAQILDNFIAFEGLDGSGKSTQLKMLESRLEKLGARAETTFEPTDGPIGRLVRQVLRHQVVSPAQALAILYSADRHDHLYNPEYGIVKKAMDGTVILTDRYFYSSLAYQTVSLDWEYIASINQYPHPRCIVYLDAPVSLCMERIDSRGEAKELFEKEEYLSRVRDNFEKAFEMLPEGVDLIRIPAELSVDEASSIVFEKVRRYISL